MRFKVFAVLALLLGIAACSERATPTEAPTDPAVTFEEAPCPMDLPKSVVEGQDIVCGYVDVPEEHIHSEGGTIRLAVAVIKSTNSDPAPDPLVVEAGGPGVSTLASASSMLASADLRAQRDIVLIEQRGTLYSKPYLVCEEILHLGTKMLGQNLSAKEKTALETEALTACRDRLVAEGVNLSAYDSLENAADIVMVLTTLGYDQFNFYGVSYSTMLAQHIMRDYPNRLRSVILDSVAPLSVNSFVQLPNNADRAFRLLFESCASDPICDQHFPNLEAVFLDLVEELNRNPATVRFEAPWQISDLMTGDRLIGLLFDGLQRGQTPLLPATIYSVANGDYSFMTRLSAPRSLPKSLLMNGMSISVLCAEQADYTDADFSLEGVYLQVGSLCQDSLDIRDYCAVWNVEPLSDDVGDRVVSDIPTLVMSGEYDPNTPPNGGSLVAETLSNSYVYTFPGISHSVLSNSLCAQSITLDFLEAPTHEPDASCIADMSVQFVVPTDDIELEPFADDELGIHGVLPAGWAKVGPGRFMGLNSKGDLAFLLLMARLSNISFDHHIALQVQRLGIRNLPESIGRTDTANFTWDLHTFEGNLQSLGGMVMVDCGIAESDAGIYLVGLYAVPDEYEQLHGAVFLPVVDALAPLE